MGQRPQCVLAAKRLLAKQARSAENCCQPIKKSIGSLCGPILDARASQIVLEYSLLSPRASNAAILDPVIHTCHTKHQIHDNTCVIDDSQMYHRELFESIYGFRRRGTKICIIGQFINSDI